ARQRLSPTPSDLSSQSPVSGAKAEGTVRELKARVESFSFNLLLEQSLVKIGVGSKAAADDNDDPAPGWRARRRSASRELGLSPQTTPTPGRGGQTKPAGEAMALRWGVGDGSLEIDYLDVRLVQSSFLLPLFVSTAGLLGKCQAMNGLNFRLGSLDSISQADQSWISCASMRDLNEMDISGAEFSSPDVVCVLWSPRLVYFTQRPELRHVASQLDDILDSANPFSGLAPGGAGITADPFASSPARAGSRSLDLRGSTADRATAVAAGFTGNPLLQRSISVQRGRAMSDLLDPGATGRPGTSGSTGSETDSTAPSLHRRNTSMPWAADAQGKPAPQLGIPGRAGLEGPGPSPEFADPRTPASAMSYKSSFHLLEIARTRKRRLTTSTSRKSVGRALSPVQSPRRTGSEHDLVEMQRQGSFQVDPSAGHAARMAPTGPDPNVIMRDSRSTQASLLLKRKRMLGDAIVLEQAALAQLSSEFEQAPGRHNEYYRKKMLQHAEHIYELSARRKLINRCMSVLGVRADGVPGGMGIRDQEDVDYDRDTQEVEKVLASLYRHRCLIYSGYLIWTSQVRDKLMRFFYVQDCLSAMEYYMSEAATGVARKATAPGSGKKASPTAPPTATAADAGPGTGAGHVAARPATAGTPEVRPPQPPPQPPLRGRADSQRSDAPSLGRSGLYISKLLRGMQSQDGSSSSSGNHGGGVRPSSPKGKKKKQRAEAEDGGYNNKFERGLSQIWDDFDRYQPYYSILVEFLNSQVSMRVDEGASTRSAIAVAERVQLHRILLCDEDEPSGPLVVSGSGGSVRSTPPTDEAVVKARSMVELENVQVFTVNRGDFENRAAYFADCTYGSPVEDSDAKPAALWPAWVPIELLLDQGTDKT
ncbi:Protein SABRE, partial [Coemansia spiralis]